MLEKPNGIKIELLPKVPKEGEALCERCGGTGWLVDMERGYIQHCGECYDGIVNLCPICKQPKHGICLNESCRATREAEQEQKRMEKATHYTLKTCPKESCEMYYSDLYGYNEGYFYDFEDLECNDDFENIDHIWGTKKITVKLDAYDVVSMALEDLHEDAFDHVNHDELAKLQVVNVAVIFYNK